MNTKSVSDLPKSGRPLKATVREIRYICRISKKDTFLTASEVSANCNILQKVSVCIIRRYVCNGGFFWWRASRKLFLLFQHILLNTNVIYSNGCMQFYVNVILPLWIRNELFCNKIILVHIHKKWPWHWTFTSSSFY